jgi:hypothetical protein
MIYEEVLHIAHGKSQQYSKVDNISSLAPEYPPYSSSFSSSSPIPHFHLTPPQFYFFYSSPFSSSFPSSSSSSGFIKEIIF